MDLSMVDSQLEVNLMALLMVVILLEQNSMEDLIIDQDNKLVGLVIRSIEPMSDVDSKDQVGLPQVAVAARQVLP